MSDCQDCNDTGRIPYEVFTEGLGMTYGSSPCICCAGAGHYWDFDEEECMRCGQPLNPLPEPVQLMLFEEGV